MCSHEPTDDGTACRYCGIPAEPGTISPDALALLAAYETRDWYGEWWRAELARDGATFDRTTWRRAHSGPPWPVTDHAIRVHAAALGIVPSRTDPDAHQRQREAADVWAAMRHAAQLMREQPSRDDLADYTAAQYAASHDAHTERELIAGLTDAAGRVWDDLPPLYRAGLDADGPYPNPARVTPTGPGHVTGLQPPRA